MGTPLASAFMALGLWIIHKQHPNLFLTLFLVIYPVESIQTSLGPFLLGLFFDQTGQPNSSPISVDIICGYSLDGEDDLVHDEVADVVAPGVAHPGRAQLRQHLVHRRLVRHRGGGADQRAPGESEMVK